MTRLRDTDIILFVARVFYKVGSYLKPSREVVLFALSTGMVAVAMRLLIIKQNAELRP